MKNIEGVVRRAINDYDMIQDGDSIAVGLSGGKDSIAALSVLSSMQKYLPCRFTLKAITVDMGFEGANFDAIARYCDKLGVEYITHKTSIANVLFKTRNEKNPCSLCANLRRGALNKLAVENGCKKVALGHHFDDAIETFFLSLFYEARLYCFSPVTYLDRMDLTVIRPLIYIEEKPIARFAKNKNLPVLHNPCPANGNTKREFIKNLFLSLEKENSNIRRMVFNAIKTGLLNKNV
ncbi:MAG: tRNA 2-thiocytidine(32) synthetase TtcA [Firmicutes bacterium]|nr:tRNA 2-thiocytidine(32) synthetase TtcA [Bacillota bacterium]